MEELKLPILAVDRLRMVTDGEGVTTLVCSMGCPLRCRLCINPASWDGSSARGALTAEELYEQVKIDSLYFLSTNGGLTFGGGEPLLHSAFLASFMEKYKSTGWVFNVETSLQVPFADIERVIPYVEHYFVDVKDMDPDRYLEYTGGDFNVFYGNLLALKERVGEGKITVKVPKIPYLHKGTEQKENEEVLKNLGFSDIMLFDYIDPKSRKPISENALKNREKLVEE